MSLVNISSQSQILPVNLYTKEEEVYKNYLNELCSELNIKEPILLNFVNDWKTSTSKPYYIHLKCGEVSEDTVKFYIAKQMYVIKKDEKKQVLKRALLKQTFVNSLLLLSIFAFYKISVVLRSSDYVKISSIAISLSTPLVLFVAFFILLSSWYQLISFDWKTDMESIDFCIQKLGKEKALLAFSELHLKGIDLGKQLSYSARLKFLNEHK